MHGLKGGLWALAFQVIVWLIVGWMDSIGLLEIQRQLLEFSLVIYDFPLSIFFWIMPSEWFTLGNMPLGFAAIAFGIIMYAFLAGIMVGLVSFLIRRNKRATR